MERTPTLLYELLRTLRERDDLPAAEAAAIVERGLVEISRLEARGTLEPATAARWREAFAAESEASAPVAGSGIHLGTARFGSRG